MDSPPAKAPACKRAANDGPTTHQLHFSYLPVIKEKHSSGAAEALLDRCLQDRSDCMAAALPMPAFRDSQGVLSNADRFCLGHAASALKNLQSEGIAGRTVVHLSTSSLTDPLLPVYVISLFYRRGVSLDGVNVTLGAGQRRRPSGGPLLDAAQSPTCVRYRTDDDTDRQTSWVDALLGRRGVA